MDRKYINNINSFVAKRFAVRKCGNAYYAMQKREIQIHLHCKRQTSDLNWPFHE